MRTLLSILMALFVCAGAHAEDAATIATILKLENERIAAGLRKDVAALEKTTADDYVQIDMNGNVRDKATQLKRIASSEVTMTANVLDQTVVRVYADTAVVTGRATATGTIRGEPYPPIRYTRVYVKRDGQWKVVLFQQTRMN
jgi:ketosteroid isomerase-like protein